MSDKDKPMSAVEAIHIIDDGDWWYWLQDDIEYDASEKMHAALDAALEALREKAERENPEPLTLGMIQSKRLSNTPVWLQDEMFVGWCFAGRMTEQLAIFDQNGTTVGISMDGHGDVWNVYEHKPREASL